MDPSASALAAVPLWFIVVVIALFGAAVGSFLNVCIYRMPLSQSIVVPGSRCVKCSRPIAWYDNIPVVSYLALRGKCRHCSEPFSPRYAVVEALTALLFVLIFLQFHLRDSAWALIGIYWLFAAALIVCTFIDFDHMLIPDVITLPGIFVGLLLAFLVPSLMGRTGRLEALVWSGFGSFIGGGSLLAVAVAATYVLKKEAMGLGDVKLMAMVGAFLGWQHVLLAIFLSSVFGSAVGIALIKWKGAGWQSRIPYGPYLSLGAVVALLWGERLINLYLRFCFPSF